MASTSMPADSVAQSSHITQAEMTGAVSSAPSVLPYTLFDIGIHDPTCLENWPPAEKVYKAIDHAQPHFCFDDAVTALRSAMKTHRSMDPNWIKLVRISKDSSLWSRRALSAGQHLHLFMNSVPPPPLQHNPLDFIPGSRSVIHTSSFTLPLDAISNLNDSAPVPKCDRLLWDVGCSRFMNYASYSIKLALLRQLYHYSDDFHTTRSEAIKMSLEPMIAKLGKALQWEPHSRRNLRVWTSMISDTKPLAGNNLMWGSTVLVDFLTWLGSVDLAREVLRRVDVLECDLIRAVKSRPSDPMPNMQHILS